MAGIINLDNTTPAPPTGLTNVEWQGDSSTPRNVSAYLPNMVGDAGSGGSSGAVPGPAAGTAAAGKFLKADGTWSFPPGSGLAGASLKTGSYTAVAADSSTLLAMNSGSAQTITLPGTPPSAIWCVFIQNIGAGVLTVSPNGRTIDGAASNLTVYTGQGLVVFTDGTNYFTSRGLPPIATSSAVGLVKPDGTTINVSSGAISVPTATTSSLGLVKPDGTTITISAGVISAVSSGGGSGAVTKIAETILTSSSSSVAFSSIPGSYRNLKVVITARCNAATNDFAYFYFNGDSANHYANWGVYGGSSGPGNNIVNPAGGLQVGAMCGNGAPSGQASSATVVIFDYARTVFEKNMHSFCFDQRSSGTGYAGFNGGVWSSTAAIISITFFLPSSSFLTGSVFSLYGES